MKHTIDYTVLFADDSLIAFNKRSGLLAAADRYDENAPRLDTLAEAEFGKLYAVHRIDRDTSGVILYARTEEARRSLSLQFQRRETEKTYHCLVYGRPLWEETTVDVPLLPDGDAQHRTVSNPHGKPSVTRFRLLAVCGQYSWLEAKPLTGRTHQIRAHLKHLELPIVCDALYGSGEALYLSNIKRKWHGDEWEERPLLNRMALHALSITFTHPSTGKRVSTVAPYQKDMEAVRRQLYKIFHVDPLLADTKSAKDCL